MAEETAPNHTHRKPGAMSTPATLQALSLDSGLSAHSVTKPRVGTWHRDEGGIASALCVSQETWVVAAGRVGQLGWASRWRCPSPGQPPVSGLLSLPSSSPVLASIPVVSYRVMPPALRTRDPNTLPGPIHGALATPCTVCRDPPAPLKFSPCTGEGIEAQRGSATGSRPATGR